MSALTVYENDFLQERTKTRYSGLTANCSLIVLIIAVVLPAPVSAFRIVILLNNRSTVLS